MTTPEYLEATRLCGLDDFSELKVFALIEALVRIADDGCVGPGLVTESMHIARTVLASLLPEEARS